MHDQGVSPSAVSGSATVGAGENVAEGEESVAGFSRRIQYPAPGLSDKSTTIAAIANFFVRRHGRTGYSATLQRGGTE